MAVEADRAKFTAQETTFISEMNKGKLRSQSEKRKKSLWQLKREKQTLTQELRLLGDLTGSKSSEALKPSQHIAGLLVSAEKSLHQLRSEQHTAAQALATLTTFRKQFQAIRE